jgi:hypothetical protein
MPIYEYKHQDQRQGFPVSERRLLNGEVKLCALPDHFEVFQKVSETALIKCPSCGAAVVKLLTVPRVHFAKKPESERKIAKQHYEAKLGRKIEKDETFATIPHSDEVVALKGLSRKQQEEKLHAAHLRAGTPGITAKSKFEMID